MVWYGKCRFIQRAIITKVSNALNTLVSGEKPGFQALSKGLIILLCAQVVRQGVSDHGAVHSECNVAYSGVVVTALDLRLRMSRVRLPALRFQVTTLGKLFTHMCLCHQTRPIIWYRSSAGDALRLGR